MLAFKSAFLYKSIWRIRLAGETRSVFEVGSGQLQKYIKKELSLIMRKVRKKSEVVYACQLGAGSGMEKEMIAEGKIRLMPDGNFELFSQEAVFGHGEMARPGDYFKIDNNGYPYPNQKKWFEENHRRLGADRYLQISKPLDAWEAGDDISEEIQFLLDTHKMTLHPDDEAHYFRAFLWGAPLAAAKNAIVILYRVDRDENGIITDISFNFIERNEFTKTYQYIKPL